MKALLVAVLGFVALICGLRAAYVWHQSTRVPIEPEGFEPVDPELRQNWWKIAEWKASERSGAFNRKAAWWTAATAVFGFASIVAGMWQNSN
jgi:hypothetical protein